MNILNIVAMVTLALVATMMVAGPAQAQSVLAVPPDSTGLSWWWEAAKAKGMVRWGVRVNAATAAAQDSANKALSLVRARPASAGGGKNGKKKNAPQGYYTGVAFGQATSDWAKANGMGNAPRSQQAEAFVAFLLSGRTAPTPPPASLSGAPPPAAPAVVDSAAALLLAEAKAMLAEAKIVADSTARIREQVDYAISKASAAYSKADDALDRITSVAHDAAALFGAKVAPGGKEASKNEKKAALVRLASF